MLEWNDDYSVSDDVIDAQHQKLFKLFNLIGKKINDNSLPLSVNETILELKEYAILHFTEEEHRMIKSDYDLYKHHKDKHDQFIKKVIELSDSADTQSDDIMLLEMFTYLKQWLTNHILIEDKKYEGHI